MQTPCPRPRDAAPLQPHGVHSEAEAEPHQPPVTATGTGATRRLLSQQRGQPAVQNERHGAPRRAASSCGRQATQSRARPDRACPRRGMPESAGPAAGEAGTSVRVAGGEAPRGSVSVWITQVPGKPLSGLLVSGREGQSPRQEGRGCGWAERPGRGPGGTSGRAVPAAASSPHPRAEVRVSGSGPHAHPHGGHCPVGQ